MSLCTNFQRVFKTVNSLFKRFIFESSTRQTHITEHLQGVCFEVLYLEDMGGGGLAPVFLKTDSLIRFSFVVTEAQTTTGSKTNSLWRFRLTA